MRSASQIRMGILRSCHENRKSHIGTSLSCVEILMAVYSVKKPDARVIISKGHAVAAVSAVLGLHITDEHTHKMPGIDWTTGSLGHGMSAGIGMAIAGKDVIVLCGDGEFDEGSCWEALGFLVSKQRHIKGKFTLIVDNNGWKGYDRTSASLKYRIDGFIEPVEVDGHDIGALKAVLSKQPKVVIANTVKGKGVSFLEDTLKSHYTSLTDEEYKQACEELES